VDEREPVTSDHGCSRCSACSDAVDWDSDKEVDDGDICRQSLSSSSSAPSLSCGVWQQSDARRRRSSFSSADWRLQQRTSMAAYSD